METRRVDVNDPGQRPGLNRAAGSTQFCVFFFTSMPLSAIGKAVYALLRANFAQFFEVWGFEKPTSAFVCLWKSDVENSQIWLKTFLCRFNGEL